jgi:hypothetical protein
MTELTFRGMTAGRGESSVVGDWWHTVDRWSLGAVLTLFALGLVLGLAASPPLAHKNDLWTYHYVVRQAVFVTMALGLIGMISMFSVTGWCCSPGRWRRRWRCPGWAPILARALCAGIRWAFSACSRRNS